MAPPEGFAGDAGLRILVVGGPPEDGAAAAVGRSTADPDAPPPDAGAGVTGRRAAGGSALPLEPDAAPGACGAIRSDIGRTGFRPGWPAPGGGFRLGSCPGACAIGLPATSFADLS